MNRPTQIGVLPPRAELSIPVSPPMAANEEPVVFCRAGDVIVTKPSPERVVLRSTVDRVAGYVLVFAPSSVVRLTRIPWAELVKQGSAMLKTILADIGAGQAQRPR